MIIRSITIEDHGSLISFWKDNYFVNDMDSLENFKIFLQKSPDLSFLAEENGAIVASALGSFDGRRGYLQKLVVKKDIRNQGVGKKLVDKVVSQLKILGVTYIPIAVEKEYVSFYKKCGFKTTLQIPMSMEINPKENE